MSLESRARAYVGKFRISQAGFETPSDQIVEDRIRQNPERRYNPLGGPVPDLSVVVLSDTHFHIAGRDTFDRTAILPTTRVMNAIRRHIGQRPSNWHREVRPTLYNDALMGWSDALTTFLDTHDVSPTKHVLLVHGGDMGDDALNQRELGIAIKTNQDVMNAISQRFTEKWGTDTQVQSLYAVGNHDADYIAWPMETRTRQIQWLYDKLGLTEHPACFLQEIIDPTKAGKGKALLVIDTNLLDKEWLKGVKEASLSAQAKIRSIGDGEVSDTLYKDALLYSVIQHHKAEQDEVIRIAQSFPDVVVLGHKPKETLQVAKSCEGEATVIAGDVHVAYDSTERLLLKLPQKRTKSGKPIRTVFIGGATRGGMGIEVPGRATAIVLKMDATNAQNAIFEISQEPSFGSN